MCRSGCTEHNPDPLILALPCSSQVKSQGREEEEDEDEEEEEGEHVDDDDSANGEDDS